MASAAVERSFGERCEGARAVVVRVLRQRGVAEVEQGWSEVCLRAWRHFPRMYAAECEALAAGEESPHDWTGWLVTIAANYATDLYRKERGRRKGECRRGGRMEVPLRSESIPAPAVSDPLVRLVLAEAWRDLDAEVAALGREERLALSVVVLEEVEEKEIAARLGVSERTVRRRRRGALGRLRHAMAARGLGEGRHFRAD